ncbi:MAG: methyltransferase domain-containing protein [Alphaproteobacteria bacterium]|nr:methyltransferase domain-containing protein [Alphaproteobacteria bacterium]
MSELRLHLGGMEPKPGWTIVNIQPGPGVDIVADITDLSGIPAASAAEVYASHVLEHVHYDRLRDVIGGIWRVLVPGGTLMISVPDLPTLCRLYLDPRLGLHDRFQVMNMMFGGHADAYDIHHVGLEEALLRALLQEAGFRRIRRVDSFGLFNDQSERRFLDQPISLNLRAQRSSA